MSASGPFSNLLLTTLCGDWPAVTRCTLSVLMGTVPLMYSLSLMRPLMCVSIDMQCHYVSTYVSIAAPKEP